VLAEAVAIHERHDDRRQLSLEPPIFGGFGGLGEAGAANVRQRYLAGALTFSDELLPIDLAVRDW
jgi:hypothetical protein